MERRNRLYKLEPILDDPRYEGFAGDYPETFSEKWLESPTTWRVKRLKPRWIPLEVEGRVRKFNDYPTVNFEPAFSERAIEVLRDFLKPNGEILPLASRVGAYFAFNITTVGNILDLRRSQVQWTVKNVLAFRVLRFELLPGAIDQLSIVRLRQQPSSSYVTETFAARARDAGLRGMNFVPVWPLPPGVDWGVEEKRRSVQRAAAGLRPGQRLKGNTVVLRLQLAGNQSTGSKAERRAIDRLMDQLDAILVDPGSDTPPIGNLEGSDYGVPGECRLFLSCPDADALFNKLEPALRNLEWPGKLTVLKRLGNFADATARDEEVKL